MIRLSSTVRNVAYNLAGQVLPMAVALVALPIIVHRAGTERLGFLGLTWALIGYFALLDLGLSRVVTRRMSIAQTDNSLRVEAQVLQRLCVWLFLGVAAISLILAFAIPPSLLVGKNASPALIDEARVALPILWATVPLTVVIGLLRGALEGMQRFARTNTLRAVFGVWSFAAPLAVLPWSVSLGGLTAAIAVGRVISLVAHVRSTSTALKEEAKSERSRGQSTLPSPNSPAKSPAKSPAQSFSLAPMLREGGWLTASNVVGPMMVTFDRFAIAAMVSLTAASYYFVPQEIALRLLVVPGAIATTVFPMLARMKGVDAGREQISTRALLAIGASSLPACALLAALAEPLIAVWMGHGFATRSAPVAAILAVGLFANCCAQAPFAWIQAAGRADVTGKLHLLQLPPYLALLIGLTWQMGIVGTALAWSARALLDCGLLFRASSILFPGVTLGRAIPLLASGTAILGLIAAMQFVDFGRLHIPIGAVLLFSALGISAIMFVLLAKGMVIARAKPAR